MSRETIFIPEKKEKIQNIKKKYNNMQMSDKDATKISRLNTVNNILKTATAAAGIVTVIDFFVPDPVLGLDEAALAAITTLLGYSSSVVNNKIEKIANSEDASIQMDEITKLTGQLTDVAGKVKKGNIK